MTGRGKGFDSGPLRIAIVGLARSGRAAAELALARGHTVFATDGGADPTVLEAAEHVRSLGGDAETGRHSLDRIAACDLLVVSPGVPPSAPVLRDDAVRRVPRLSELEFAWRHLRSRVIAITGTNGKSTTTALAAYLLREAGLDAPEAGNIGRALSDVALADRAPDWVVVEASSFQLADTAAFRPDIGVLTNLAPDHLDRYPSVQAYYGDKARIFDNAGPDSLWILGAQPEVLALARGVPGRRLLVHDHGPPGGDWTDSAIDTNRTNGTDRTDGTADGAWIVDDTLIVRIGGEERRLVGTAELRLLGPHNQVNALFAAVAALSAGADEEAVRRGLRGFAPLAHRLEPVGEVEGVLWINDSKATNLASARVGIASMTRPTVVLLGGKHKGESYTGLLEALRAHATAVVAYGEAAPLIERDLGGHIRVERVTGTFEEVLERAASVARPGDAVLLSPACSSYDMFRDYEQRGAEFRRLALRGRVSHGG